MKNINLTKIKFAAAFISSLLFLFFSCKFMLKGAGGGAELRDIFLLCTLIIIFNSSKKAFLFIIIPMASIYALYTPIGMIFGKPSYQYIASIFSTDMTESKEFLLQIPIKNYFYSIAILVYLIAFHFLTKKFNINFYKNKTLLCVLILFSMINQSPIYFFKYIYHSSIKVKDELVKLNKISLKSEWGNSTLNENSNYDNYILIIGESARKDYHHSYGYPISNTPFMDISHGVLVDGLTSGGTNTIASLRLMLTKPDKDNWEPNYGLNFIDLAKSAGIKTYWLSNQGYFGDFDTPISAIAKKSDSKFFLKSGNSTSKNTSDFELLPKLRHILDNKPNEKKLIVLHIYGSHPNACDRINNYELITHISDKKYSYLNCYISSIKKTDDFLQNVHEIADINYKKTNKKYSILYFSDHGLAHREIDNIIIFNNNRTSYFHFNIPLFTTSSDSKERKICNSFKSGLNFTESLGNWMGIKNDKISLKYNLFDCKNDTDDYGLIKKLKKLNAIADPAIDLSDK